MPDLLPACGGGLLFLRLGVFAQRWDSGFQLVALPRGAAQLPGLCEEMGLCSAAHVHYRTFHNPPSKTRNQTQKSRASSCGMSSRGSVTLELIDRD